MISVVKRPFSAPTILARAAGLCMACLCWGMILITAGCDNNAPDALAKKLNSVAFQGQTMGSKYMVKISDLPTNNTVTEVNKGIANILADLHAKMTTYDHSSEVSRFNSSTTTDWFPVSGDVCIIVTEALRISKMSAGAFDITVGPLVNLWGFGPDAERTEPPTTGDIQQAMQRVGYQHIQARCDETPALRKDQANVAIDLSAIAHGYGADKVADYLDSLHIQDYLVDVAGELRGKGLSPRGQAWLIGVEKPVPGSQGDVVQVVMVKNAAVATSGTYRNFFAKDGIRYSHTIDPKTGRPITHNLVSATIVTQKAATADALATVISVLGFEAGFELAKKEGLAVYAILQDDKDNKILVGKTTPQIIPYLVMADKTP